MGTVLGTVKTFFDIVHEESSSPIKYVFINLRRDNAGAAAILKKETRECPEIMHVMYIHHAELRQ